jgi:hypothetical protein
MKNSIYPALVILLALLMGCDQMPTASTGTIDLAAAVAETPALETKPALPDSATFTQLATVLLQYAAAKDYAKIADHIHPVKGIRFSPYPYVDSTEHKHFTAIAFRQQATQKAKKKLVWGTYDPQSDPIKLTVAGYFKEFGYDKDYLGKGRSAYDEPLGSSTILDNCMETYPQAHFVEYYYGGDDPENEAFTWGSIRLVMEMHGGKPYLVAWIHNAWAT